MGRRTHAQLDESLSPNPDSLGEEGGNYLALLHFVCGIITWRAAGLFR
jgi:hypothetical protein